MFDSPQPRQGPNRATNLYSQRRVSQIIQASGKQSSTSVNANRSGQQQFFASSAPSSPATLNHSSRPNRPPVPLFHQSTGSVPTAKMMNAADVDLGEYVPFEGEGHTAFSSPAMPTSFDFSGSVSSSASNLGTVSPHDLLVNEPFMSAPNSSALTALTSPSINESPDFDPYDVSPHFGSADFDGPPADAWYSLFPTEAPLADPQPQLQQQPQQQPASVDNSPAQQSDDLSSSERPLTGTRRKSDQSPPSSTRHSSVSGVNSRKRDKPLPPIIIDDPNDTTAMKRARNTLAARKSRERKAQRLDELEAQIAKLEQERDHWKNIALSK